MCGIVGYLDLQGAPVDREPLARMAAAQHHRGPDASGAYVDGPVALGSQRLSIIDLQGGNQPIFNEDRTIAIVYNGELYNYVALRRELEGAGHRFTTSTDTEVIVHAFEEYGLSLFDRLNGMYAFALWDGRSRRLLLGRDPLGMKPLYWTEREGKLWFASEVKGLLASAAIRAELEPTVLSEYLLYQNILGAPSLFRGIQRLDPGHYLLAEAGRLKKVQHWDVAFEPRSSAGLEEHLERYRQLMGAAVERHMIADVAVGSYLSSGYDASAVALLASRGRPEGFHTFTGAFPGQGAFFDERAAAHAVAERCGRNLHHDVSIDAESFWGALDRVVFALDEPSIGCGAVPQFLVAQEVSRHVKVVLTGHGGDELCLGYEAYKALYMRQSLLRDPWRFLSLLTSVRISELPRLAYFGLSPDPVVRSGLLCLFPANEIRSLLAPAVRAQLGDHDPRAALARTLAPVRDASPVERAIYLYLKTYLPTLLVQEDKVGMAHSVESRMPLCDRELVAFMLSVPVEHKLHGGQLKYFPRHGLSDLYPPEILRQPKRGFPTPIARWFQNELRSRVEDRLFGPDSPAGEVLDLDRVRRIWSSFLRLPQLGVMTYYLSNRIYSVLSLVSWYRTFVGRP